MSNVSCFSTALSSTPFIGPLAGIYYWYRSSYSYKPPTLPDQAFYKKIEQALGQSYPQEVSDETAKHMDQLIDRLDPIIEAKKKEYITLIDQKTESLEAGRSYSITAAVGSLMTLVATITLVVLSIFPVEAGYLLAGASTALCLAFLKSVHTYNREIALLRDLAED